MCTQTLHLRDNHSPKGCIFLGTSPEKLKEMYSLESIRYCIPSIASVACIWGACTEPHLWVAGSGRWIHAYIMDFKEDAWQSIHHVACCIKVHRYNSWRWMWFIFSNVEVYECRLDQIFLGWPFFDNCPWSFKTSWSKVWRISLMSAFRIKPVASPTHQNTPTM